MKFWIPSNNITNTKKALEKFARKHAKYGADVFAFSIGNEYEIRDVETHNGKFKIMFYPVEVEGSYIVETDWQVVAKLEHIGEGNVVSIIDTDIEFPKHYQKAGCACEHCNIDRHRVVTYVLYNAKKNEYKQVGKSCLKDFMGVDATKLVFFKQFISELRDTDSMLLGENYREDKYFELSTFITAVKELVSTKGWVPKNTIIDTPGARDYKFNKNNTADAAVKLTKNITVADEEFFNKVKEYINTSEDKEGSNYIANLKVIFNNKYFLAKQRYLVASAVQSYEKHLEYLRKQAAKAEMLANKKPITVVAGDKVDNLNIVVERIAGYESDYGWVRIFIMRAEDGNLYVWKTTSGTILEQGMKATIKGTVKDITVYNDEEQIVLTRVKVLTVKSIQ